ncbi:hypothetical protein N8T08_004936 [Aspergillus melleus]|uniref:Uncharacterized protein n=1 Tax=Aspergillus melleus TaxID=138277 RepID=A0ACC3B374_9EURO|nr:hypothetical protein N8T08_004936 [Aspergillus melleus]
MSEFIPFWEQPSHPDRLQVVKGDQPYKSAAYSLISLPAGAFFAKINTATFVDHTTYTSVANGKDLRIELNSDLVYCNHSCNPSLVFDMTRFEVRVSEDRPLAVGDELSFFYPSTEWEMVQPFRCECSAGPDKCLGFIAGSSKVEPSTLARFWLNDHIRQLLEVPAEADKQPSSYAMEAPVVDSPGA